MITNIETGTRVDEVARNLSNQHRGLYIYLDTYILYEVY